jgi:hypothetical protein
MGSLADERDGTYAPLAVNLENADAGGDAVDDADGTDEAVAAALMAVAGGVR